MTILSIVQNACYELGLPAPSSVVGSTDAATVQLLALLKRTVEKAREEALWPKLTKEKTFTLATGTANYALPTDFDQQLNRTIWNRSSYWELLGPLSPQEWQFRKSGIVSATPRQRFRIKGWELEQLFIDPTPDASVNGNTVAFEYQSTIAVVPKTWATSTAFAASSYCSYDGNIYQTTAGGTTGATPPTHTSGSVSDGAVTWTYYSAAYAGYLADTDYCLIDEDLITVGLQWRYLRAKGLDYGELQREYNNSRDQKIVNATGAKTLSLVRRPMALLLNAWNVRDSGYGS